MLDMALHHSACVRALEEMFLAKGARIGYWRGSIEGVAEDLQVWHCQSNESMSLSLLYCPCLQHCTALHCTATSFNGTVLRPILLNASTSWEGFYNRE